MRPPQDHIVAAVLPRQVGTDVQSHLDTILQANLDESYFEGTYQHLFNAAVSATLLNVVLDDEVLQALLKEKNLSAEDTLKCQIMLRDLQTVDVSKEKLKVLLPSYRDTVHAGRVGEALEEAVTILTEGVKIDGEVKEGYRAARSHIMARLAELDEREIGVLPTKEIRETADELKSEYQSAKNGNGIGVYTGFHDIDNLTNGIQKSELWVFCAYTGEGKTQLLLNCAYNAAIRQGKNVAFVSLEMPLSQVRRRLASRHSNHLRFGLPGGLEYTRIKDGKLDKNEEKLYYQVVDDFRDEASYGKIHVLQIAKSETVKSMNERLMYVRSRHKIDLLVVDYASLLSASRRRSERRDEIVEVIESLKGLALTFNEGEGLPILTANQVSRKARDEAEQLKKYGLNFASETSAIEKNSDLLAWLLRLEEFKANKEVLMGISKYRDGDIGKEFTLVERYESSLLDNLGRHRTI